MSNRSLRGATGFSSSTRRHIDVVTNRLPNHRCVGSGLSPFFLLLLIIAVGAITTAEAVRAESTHLTNPNLYHVAIQDVQTIATGTNVERPLTAGTSHTYVTQATAGEVLRIKVDQLGIDVALTVSGPDGQQLSQMDSPNGLWGTEAVSLVAPASGDYQIKVRSTEKFVSPGNYRLTVEKSPTPSHSDALRIEAEQAFVLAQKLRIEGKADSLANAVVNYQKALDTWKTLQDADAQAKALVGLARTSWTLRKKEDAVAYFKQALALRQAMKDAQGEGYVLNDLGRFSLDVGEPNVALDWHSKALAIFHTLNEPQSLAITFNHRGLTHARSGNYEEALQDYGEALRIWTTTNNVARQALVLNNIAGVEDLLGKKTIALEKYRQALSIFQTMEDVSNQSNTLNNIAKVLDDVGEWELSLQTYEQALQLTKGAPRSLLSRKATLLDNIGMLYTALGDWPAALQRFNEALALQEEIGDERGQGYSLGHFGWVYLLLDNPTEAKKYLDRSLKLREKVTDQRGQAISLTLMGMALSATKDLPGALRNFQDALAIWEKVADVQGRTFTLNRIAGVQLSLGNANEAAKNLEEALTLAQKIKLPSAEATARLELAKLNRDKSDLRLSLQQVLPALDLLETIRRRGSSQQLRTSFFATKQDYYDLAIEVLMSLHQQAPLEGFERTAFQISERKRARSLLDTLATTQVPIRGNVKPEVLHRYESARQHWIERLEYQSRLLTRKHTDQQAQEADADVRHATTEYNRILTDIQNTNPHYAALTQPMPIRVEEAQRSLDANTLLLEYALGEKRSYVWAVTPDSVKGFQLESRDQIEAVANRLVQALTARNRQVPNETFPQRTARENQADKDYLEAANALSKIVIEPVASLLGEKKLVIVADGALQYVPFAALPTSVTSLQTTGTKVATPTLATLISNHEIVTLPSASVLVVQRQELANRKPAPFKLAVLADPVFDVQDPRVVEALARANRGRKLPTTNGATGQQSSPPKSASPTTKNDNSTLVSALRDVGLSSDGTLRRLVQSRTEATEITRTTPANESLKALDFRASRATATSGELSKYQYVHFATHGILSLEHPELSGIALSMVDEKGQPQNGYLRLNEIYNLNLPAELVVLSACETGVGKQIRGEGLIALTRGFMYAGAKRVVASLWKVDDSATAELMAQFYKEMFVNKKRPPEALKEAQKHISNQRRWRSPYFWAGFVLQGEWR